MTWSWKEGVYRSWFIRGTRRFRIIFRTIPDTLTEIFTFFSFFTEWSYEIGLRLIWRMTLSSLSRNKISPSRISEEDFPLLRQEGGIIEEETEKNIGTLDYLWLKFHFCKKKKRKKNGNARGFAIHPASSLFSSIYTYFLLRTWSFSKYAENTRFTRHVPSKPRSGTCRMRPIYPSVY